MCGFAGFLGPPSGRESSLVAVRAMARTLIHRGPDDEGAWVDAQGRVGFGFRRLSILDLTQEGHQPMVSSDGRYALVMNGEVYNFLSLRAELELLGHRFRGRSDTEVVLAAVSAWGIAATLPRLSGMFACAIWDERLQKLHLVRDQLGKKPLYYGWQGNTLLFGSELKALRAHPLFAAQVDRDALAAYLRYSYIPAPLSIYQGINKLPPASWVTLSPDQPGTTPAPVAFWEPVQMVVAGRRAPPVLDEKETLDRLDVLLRDAVRLRMVADVPLGAFLSGGIDSSLVVALMQAQSTRPVRTFTIGYGEKEYDETPYARAVAEHLGTDHSELRVTSEDALSVVPRLPFLYDEPFADASQIPTALVSVLARRSVTVALSGDGGDELFGGYNRYVIGSRLLPWLGRAPVALRRKLAALLTSTAPASWARLAAGFDAVAPRALRGLLSGNRIHKLAGVLSVGSADELYDRLVSCWPNPGEIVLGNSRESRKSDPTPASLNATERMMLRDLLTYLPDDILVKVDRASMAVGLEVRAPLLDLRVAEFAWSLPLSLKIRGNEGKWLLRRLLDAHLPRVLLERPKQGFGVPIDSWLRGPLRAWAEDLLAEDRLARENYFNPLPIRRAWKEHLSGSRNFQYQLWAILMFQSWLDSVRVSKRVN